MGNSAIEKQFKTKAIHSLVPNGVYHDGQKPPTDDEINAKLAEMIKDWEASQYAYDRQTAYPDIGDQLDDLYKEGVFSASMAAKLKKVKDDNPKG